MYVNKKIGIYANKKSNEIKSRKKLRINRYSYIHMYIYIYNKINIISNIDFTFSTSEIKMAV